MRNRSKLASLSAATTALTFLAVTAGGLVRATGSGLGCPGWPRCYGRLVPPADAHAIIEMTHRYLVSGSVLGAITVCASALLWHRRDRTAVVLGLVLVPLFFAQAALGAYVVHRELLAWTVVAHLALAMVVVATLIVLTVHLRDRAPAVPARLAAPAGVAAAATFGLMLLGSYVTGRGAGLAFRDWPLMGGRLVPAHLSASGPLLQFTHRLAALLAAALVGLVAARARGVGGPGRTLARLAAALFGVEILVGGLNVFTRLHSAVVTTHLGLSAAIWAVLVALWALARTGAREPEAAAAVPAPGLRVAEKIMAFVALTKPRIIELLLVTTVPTMIVAKRGLPSLWLVVATVGGGTLAAGGANAINNYVDRDIDKVMRRTRSRPLVTGAVSPRAALAFAVVLEAVAFAELWAFVNLLSALLAVSATLFYVFVYTLWLKRSSSQNIVIGGAAGAVPVLVGWSAVTGSLGLAPLVLFALIFWWTPPHFWALAIRYREDYAAAEVPMLPVVASMAATARRILAYTLLLWAASLAFWPVAGMGRLYLGAAIVLGGLFTYYAVQLLRKATAARAMRLFGYSISYISLLFGTMAVDRLIH